MKFITEPLGSYMDSLCEQYQDRQALVFPKENITYTYGQFKKLYTRIAKGLLAAGIQKGDHIAVLALNSPLWLALQIAAAKIGCVMVCLNTGYTANELAYVLNHSRTSLLFMTNGGSKHHFLDTLLSLCTEPQTPGSSAFRAQCLLWLQKVVMLDNSKAAGTTPLQDFLDAGDRIDDDRLRQAETAVDPQDVANIQYTSGTTGNPKAVMSMHSSIINNALISGQWLEYTADDSILLCLPFFHVIGYVLSAVAGLFAGARLVVVERFETEFVMQCLEKEKCTVFNGVPTMFNYLLHHADRTEYDFSNLKKGFIAGSRCSQELMLDIIHELGISGICNVYGQTEAIAITQTRASDNLAHRIGSIGKPLPGVEAKIMDIVTGEEIPVGHEGELCVKSAYLMKGYYKDAGATQKAVDAAGWLHTGDLATLDSEGYLSIIGRIKDMIIRGGENISPAEIEHVVKTYEGIQDVAVIAVPDEMLGEEIFAFLIVEPCAEISIESLKSFLSQHIARYKIPKYFAFVSEFPVTSSGKIRKFALKELAVQNHLHR